jgi:dienelactone hydrolase
MGGAEARGAGGGEEVRAVCLAVALAAVPLQAQTIRVAEDALADEPFVVAVEGLQPHQAAIVRAYLDDASGAKWQSWAGFLADARGRATIDRDLIAAMDVAGADRGRKRFVRTGAAPLKVELALEIGGRTVATAIAKRTFAREGVTTTPVREEDLTGTFFQPAAGSGLAVLVLGGSEGGIGDEGAAALLASRGFPALALQYFDGALADVPLERFTRALDWLARRPGVQATAILGTSKGAEAALLVASRRNDLRAVVAYAPSSVAWSCICDRDGAPSWTERGAPVPFVAQRRDPTYAPPQGFPIEPGVHYEYRLRSRDAAARIPVENIRGDVLLIAGDEDRMWPSAAMAREIAARKKSRVLILPGAGHLIGKANLPPGTTLTGNGRLETGGTPAANAAARKIAWEEVLRFLSAARDRAASARSRARS